jgi:Cu(I)/Ag(I) efflux system membrane protein CusA/SilA
MQFPEVERVFGKIGRAKTPTDPAPLNMAETVVTLKPEEEWRPGVTWDSLLGEMDRTLRLPGMPNIWWMPIQTRTEMLATGIRSVLGIKVLGPNLNGIEQIGRQIEAALAPLRGTRSVYYDRTLGGYYLDFHIKRDEAARYGLTVGDVEDIIETAIGGKDISQTVEGRERYPINVRYARELRDDVEMLKRVLVPTPTGRQIPIVQLAELRFAQGPPMIRNELGQLVGFVFVDVVGRDLGGYVEEAKRTVAERVQLPPGYTLLWAGQFEYQLRAKETLKVVVPFTVLLIFLLLYLNTTSVARTLIILVAAPFSAVGAIWLLYLLDYNMSVAVWIGLIALLGVDAETGMFMLLYLDLAYEERRRQGKMQNWDDLREAIIQGAVQRLRPKVMTVGVMFIGLLPIMWSTGAGADVMKRIAAPMVGGIFTSFFLELLVYPAIYAIWKWRWEVRPSLAQVEVTK